MMIGRERKEIRNDSKDMKREIRRKKRDERKCQVR